MYDIQYTYICKSCSEWALPGIVRPKLFFSILSIVHIPNTICILFYFTNNINKFSNVLPNVIINTNNNILSALELGEFYKLFLLKELNCFQVKQFFIIIRIFLIFNIF